MKLDNDKIYLPKIGWCKFRKSRDVEGTIKNVTVSRRYEFRRQLTYKEQWRGGVVVLINPANTSRICSACSHKACENRQSQAHFQCVACGHSENADLNAARNILAVGRTVLACGDTRQIAV